MGQAHRDQVRCTLSSRIVGEGHAAEGQENNLESLGGDILDVVAVGAGETGLAQDTVDVGAGESGFDEWEVGGRRSGRLGFVRGVIVQGMAVPTSLSPAVESEPMDLAKLYR
jgi:hypothetical protein